MIVSAGIARGLSRNLCGYNHGIGYFCDDSCQFHVISLSLINTNDENHLRVTVMYSRMERIRVLPLKPANVLHQVLQVRTRIHPM